jgi:GNAT superfamily N-acetyltransferase
MVEHLLALDESDRYLRFGYPASDEQIRRYALSIDFDRDEVLGVFNRRLRLVALAHVAYEPAPQVAGRPSMAEFGVSVLPHARGRGLGARLFEAAGLHARNRGVDTLFIHALTENTAMLHIARSAGAIVERDGGESQAWLRLPPGSVSSHLGEAIERQLAELDFQLKRNAHVLGEFVDGIADVKSQFGELGGPGKD